MTDFALGFFSSILFFMLIEPLIVNYIYLSNCDLFLDLILLKSKRKKLIDCCYNRFYE